MEGIIPLWKPRGMTSHDCVFKLRKILRTKKIGHSGTLDPDVDGVLPICVGRATKVVEYLQDSNKTYSGEVTLGFSTETEDASGEVVTRTPIEVPFSTEKIDEAMARFIGEIKQQPPMYSAVKVNGRRLYDYARKGETVERPIRTAKIYDYKRTSQVEYDAKAQLQKWSFDVECGKGTYVRTLAVDTGKELGVEAHMSTLTRTGSGSFTKEDCVTLEEVQQAMDEDTMDEIFFPLEYGLESFEKLAMSKAEYAEIKNGLVVPSDYFEQVQDASQWPILLTYQDQAISIYDLHPTKPGKLKPVKVFRND